MVGYNQLCMKCKKNYVPVLRQQRYVLCYDCQKKQLSGDIKDPAMKKLFGIPEEFYKASSFLRDIKSNYFKFGMLTQNQIDAFKKVVDKMKKE